MTFREKSLAQLDTWVAGEPKHMAAEGEHGDQCCPDFSCCRPDFLQPLDVREAYRAAYVAEDEETTYRMLGAFLGAAVATAFDEKGKKVHIAGAPLDDEVQ